MNTSAGPSVRGAGSSLAAIRRIRAGRPTAAPEERCDLCAAPVAEEHNHVVDVEDRSLQCACRACYLLFTDQHARLRFKAVPERYLSFPDFAFTSVDWDDLQIPVELFFCFRNSVQERMVTFYPSPAGATESELPMSSWDRLVERNPRLDLLLPDVEALLIRGAERGGHGEEFTAHLVPIDACYELVGRMRMTWRGFDGGQEARAAMSAFFDGIGARSRPAPEAAGAP